MKARDDGTTEKLLHSTGSGDANQVIAVNPIIKGGKPSPVIFICNQCLDREDVTELILYLQSWLDKGRL